MKSCFIAFAMYSKLPMPQVDWDEKSCRYTLCFFPLVGVVIGLLLWGWMVLSNALSIGSILFGAIAVTIPLLVTGGIHMDGFCDTCDALASHQSTERKLEILKDSHAGAFAIIWVGVYLLLLFAGWCEVDFGGGYALPLCLVPVFSRCLSGLCANWKKARKDGLLVSLSPKKPSAVLLVTLFLLYGLALACVTVYLPFLSLWIVLISLVIVAYYAAMTKKQFGGVTGDTAGWLLQVGELALLYGMILFQKVELLL